MTIQVMLMVLSFPIVLHSFEDNSKSNLHGVVKDPYAAVLRGANIDIALDAPSGENENQVNLTTDQFGKYETKLPPGEYKVCASGRGLEKTCHCVRIVAELAVELDFSMRIDKRYILPTEYDVLDHRLQILAGKNAVNCGHADENHAPTRETACARAAHTRNKPFLVRYDVKCGDCKMSFGLASDALGRLFAVRFDSMGMSTWEPSPAETMPDGIFTVVAPCPPYPGLRMTRAGTLSCFSATDKADNIMQQLDGLALSGRTAK